MSDLEAPAADVSISEIDSSIPKLTHEHCYASRLFIIQKLENSQSYEHDALLSMRKISERNSERILDILIKWLREDYAIASQEDFDAISQIGGKGNIQKWRDLASEHERKNLALKAIESDLSDAENRYQALNPSIWGRIRGSKGEKLRIRQAKQEKERCENDLRARKDDLNTQEIEIKTFAKDLLNNCCQNLHSLSVDSALSMKLHASVKESETEIFDTWQKHCQQQQEEIAVIEKHLALLKSIYQTAGV